MKKVRRRWIPARSGLGRVLLVLALLVPLAARAQDGAQVGAQEGAQQGAQEPAEEHPGFLAAKGRVTFRVYCASCHGPKGLGDGNLAQYLKVQPTDVTRLSQRNEGKFPLELLTRIIDGRQPVRGHGTKEMPVWGDVFQSPLSEQMALPGESGEQRAMRKIKELVLFLETIQVGVQPQKPAAQDGR